MSEVTELREAVANLRNDLLKQMVDCDSKAQVGRNNDIKRKKLNKEINELQELRDDLVRCFNYTKDIYKNVEAYLNEKRESGEDALKLAISQAGSIVPDADTDGIHLVINKDNGNVYVADKEGIDINDKEGSAFRTVLGVLLRYTFIKSLPHAIQFIAFDEGFATCSDETSVRLRRYIDLLKDDIIFVGIEQRSVLYEGIDRKVFVARKVGKVSTIKEAA